jgi:hypothetical protein
MPSLLINDEKIKDPEKSSENLSLHEVGKEDPISFLKMHFLANSIVLKLS